MTIPKELANKLESTIEETRDDFYRQLEAFYFPKSKSKLSALLSFGLFPQIPTLSANERQTRTNTWLAASMYNLHSCYVSVCRGYLDLNLDTTSEEQSEIEELIALSTYESERLLIHYPIINEILKA